MSATHPDSRTIISATCTTSTVNNLNTMVSYDNENMSEYTSYFHHEDTFGSSISPQRGQHLKLSSLFRRRHSVSTLMKTDQVTISERQGMITNVTALIQARNNIVSSPELIPESAAVDNWQALYTIGESTANTQHSTNDAFTESSNGLLQAPSPPSPGLITRLTGLFSYRNDFIQNEMLSVSALGNNVNVTDSHSLHADITNNHNNNVNTQDPSDYVSDSASVSSGLKDYFTRRKASITISDLNAYAPISL